MDFRNESKRSKDEIVYMLFGLGLAGAVLLDALIVRSVLVPGLMWLGRASCLGSTS